jgi:F-type H+-transporting ATPase subunit b
MVQKGLSLVFIILTISTTNALASEELLKIDKTLIIQVVIFIATIFILNSVLFKPLLQLVERREALTTGRLKEAKELEARVTQIMKEYKEKLDEVRAKAMQERNEIRREALTAGEKIIAKAHNEAQALLQEAKAKLESEAREIREKIKPEIEILARETASQILGRDL